jgi:hypothetical protein
MSTVAFRPFETYVSGIVELATRAARDGLGDRSVVAELNGQAGHALRTSVGLQARRDAGTFFTGTDLADRLIDLAQLSGHISDPACGAGDLLLAAARQLPVSDSLDATLEAWSSCLSGRDVNPAFLELTRARLVLLALSRGALPSGHSIDMSTVFTDIRVGDTLASHRKLDVDGVLLNPPYGTMPAPVGWPYGSGLVSRAAVFVSHAVRRVPIGTNIACILPDVLRSGSRYAKWRNGLASDAEVVGLEAAGRFDLSADVDVFLLVLRRSDEGSSWPTSAVVGRTLGQDFNVRVGAVVPHRDEAMGPRVRYLDARALPPLAERELLRWRRFAGTTFVPPFVVVRRTSRPRLSPGPRLIVNVVEGDGPIAVENHLLVLTPHRGGAAACKRLARYLTSEQVTAQLDATAARRHLTVGDLRGLPAPSADRGTRRRRT